MVAIFNIKTNYILFPALSLLALTSPIILIFLSRRILPQTTPSPSLIPMANLLMNSSILMVRKSPLATLNSTIQTAPLAGLSLTAPPPAPPIFPKPFVPVLSEKLSIPSLATVSTSLLLSPPNVPPANIATRSLVAAKTLILRIQKPSKNVPKATNVILQPIAAAKSHSPTTVPNTRSSPLPPPAVKVSSLLA